MIYLRHSSKSIAISFLVTIFTFQACTSQELVEEHNEVPEVEDNPGEKITYLALGDSYTIGESVDEKERWPVQLKNYLSSALLKVEEPRIIARTGWTTDELNKAIDQASIKDTFSLVSLLIGVNNQYRGRTATQFRPEFEGLLNKAISLAGGNKDRVFVLSIPDWGATPYASNLDREKIGKEIDSFNAVCKDEALKAGVKYFDITPISRRAINESNLIANDGLHPSGKMYSEWIELIGSDVRNLLNK